MEARSRELGVRAVRVLYGTSYSASIELLAPRKAKNKGGEGAIAPPAPPPDFSNKLLNPRSKSLATLQMCLAKKFYNKNEQN